MGWIEIVEVGSGSLRISVIQCYKIDCSFYWLTVCWLLVTIWIPTEPAVVTEWMSWVKMICYKHNMNQNGVLNARMQKLPKPEQVLASLISFFLSDVLFCELNQSVYTSVKAVKWICFYLFYKLISPRTKKKRNGLLWECLFQGELKTFKNFSNSD